MEIISGLISNNQKVQSAEEVIPTLCDRLQHSRLASDRRAAILALKGFSRQYRESVVANGLRGLISTLTDFSLDTEILKACLETLLILFIRGEGDDDLTRNWISQQSRFQNGKYPSPLLMKEESTTIDQFSLWIADEVTQDDHNVEILISLLENNDFYVRLYTLQFLEALVSTRPLKTKESILNSPLGISSLVQVLGDSHDPIRNETVLLLMAIANDNFNIQKLIAFESTFDRLFEIIHEEGDIRGSIVVQDCLTLVSNLLRYNVSNQKLFLETNCLPKLSFLISEPLGEDAIVWNDQRLQNINICLEIVGLFVIQGNESTKLNQNALFKADVFLFILQLAFSENTPNSIRPTALITVGSLINENKEIQSNFGSIDVPYIDPSLPIQLQRFEGSVPVVIALLNWCLYLNSVHVFDIRVAAESLLEAYFNGNDDAKLEFIEDQIKKFKSNEIEDEPPLPPVEAPKPIAVDENEIKSEAPEAPKTNGSSLPLKRPPVANIFEALLEYYPDIKLNPYRIWFSSVILIKLIHDNEELKSIVTSITSGDEEAGEDVITAIQAISGLLVTTISTQDQRISIGYLMLLIVWLYEDFEAVNDFLSESSNVRALLSYLSQVSNENSIIQGLVAILLGVAFEFSSKDSPFPRVDFHALIVKMLGKDNYGFKLLQFKENPLFSEFSDDDIYDPKRDETGLPKVFLHSVVVNLIKENYYRFKNTLNQDPTLEPNGRISYEKYELLQETYHSLKKDYDDYQLKSEDSQKRIEEALQTTSSKLTDVTETSESATAELAALRSDYEKLKSNYGSLNSELETLKQEHSVLSASSTRQQRNLESSSGQIASKEAEISRLKQQLETVQKQKTAAEDGINKMSRELMQLTRSKELLEGQVKGFEKDAQKNIKEQHKRENHLKQVSEEVVTLKSKIDVLVKETNELKSSKHLLEQEITELKSKNGNNDLLIEQLTEKLRSLANKFNDLTDEKSALETQLSKSTAEFSAEIEALKDKVKQLELTNDDLSRLSDNLVKENEATSALLKNTKDEAEVNLKQLNDELIHLRSSYTGAVSDLDASKSLSLKYEGQIRELNQELKNHQSAVADLKDNHSRELSSQQDTIEQLKNSTAKQKKNLDASLSSLNEKLTKVEAEKKTLEEEIGTNIIELEKLKNDLEAKENIVKDLTSKSTGLSSEITTLQSANGELSKSLKELEAELVDRERTAASGAAEVSDLKEVNEKLNLKLKNLEEQQKKEKKDSSEKVAKLTESTKALEIELDDIAAEYETKESALKKTIASLTGSNTFVTEEKKSLESTLQMISQTMEQKEREFEELSKVLKSKSSELVGLNDKFKTTEDAKSVLEKSLQSSKDEISALKQEIKSFELKFNASAKELKKKTHAVEVAEKKLSEQNSKHSTAVIDLEATIERLRSTLDSKSTEFEKERSLLSENSSSTTKEYSEKVTRLGEELKQMEKKFGIQISVLEKQKHQLEEKISVLEDEKAALAEDLTTRDDQVTLLESSLGETKTELTTITKELDDTKASISEFSTLKEQHSTLEDAQKKIISEFELEKSKTKELLGKLAQSSEQAGSTEKLLRSEVVGLQEKVKGLQNSSSYTTDENAKLLKKVAALEGKAVELESSLTSTLQEKDAGIKESKDLLANKTGELEKLKSDINEKSKELGELKGSNKKLEDELKSIETSNNQIVEELTTKIEQLAAEKNQSDAQLKDLTDIKAENKKIKEEIEAIKFISNDLANANEENEKLKKELAKLKETTVAKSELDDMMLVLDDLDEKKNSYKAKVKALGGEISSDEEDDDDNEEDDDEE